MNSDKNLKKNVNPRQNANFFKIVTFFYTFPLFFKGSKRELQESDLYEILSSHKSSKLGNEIEKAWKDEVEASEKQKRTPSLARVLIKFFALDYLKFGIIHLFLDIFLKIGQSLFLAKLIDFYTPNQTDMLLAEAYLHAAGLAVCSLGSVLLLHPTLLEEFQIGMKIRIACCSLLYRKSLRLNTSAYQETTIGQIVNLLSNDVSRFDILPQFMHYLWIGPLQTLISLYLMYEAVGISAVFGVLFVLLYIPLQIFLAKLAAKLRLKTAIRTDERVRLMNEIILGMQVIKMYTWEKPYTKFVELARKYEIDMILVASYVKAIYSSFTMFTGRTALFITIIIYVSFYEDIINPQKVFLLTSLYNTLRFSMAVVFPNTLLVLSESKISVNRLNKFLLYKEQTPSRGEFGSLSETDYFSIQIKNATGKWMEGKENCIFNNISLGIKKGELVAVIGPVGSGKSSLFQLILKELPLISGHVNVNGKISYASQDPWLFSNNVLQNILFGDELNNQHYKSVVNRCALAEDFKLFPYGDKTMVGERGITLSGGQKARVNLARAIYKKADIYLLDDPLSAVDTHVGKHIFQKCIMEYLEHKTVILITHQLQYLKEVDRIVIIENGTVKAEGTYNKLKDLGLDFVKFLKLETELNQESESIKKVSADRVPNLYTDESVTTKSFNLANSEAHEENKSEGSISGYVYKSYVAAGGNWCTILLLVFLLICTQVLSSLSDYFITFWVNLMEDREKKQVTTRGSFLTLYAKNCSFSNIAEQNSINNDNFMNFSNESATYIYSGLTILVILFTLIRSITFFKMSMTASINLHKRLFNSIIYSKMFFFNMHSSGRILNRFSNDVGSIDERLPLIIIQVIQMFLNVLGVIIIVIVINYWIVIPSIVIIITSCYLRIFYIKTSRAVKRLEGTTRSPIFQHMNATLEGLPTIRAFSLQKKLQQEFDNYIDINSSAWLSCTASAVAFGYWLDLISVLYIIIVILTFVLLDLENSGGNVGLAITQSISLTGLFQWAMKQSTEMENQMTSVERILEYINDVEPEVTLESSSDSKPKPNWPTQGVIKFENVYLKYSLNDPPVLKNLNFTIGPLEKIGIVGRTGAGKSSLIASLFRLSNYKGAILIDNIDTGKIGLRDLRSKLSIIPQEPILFSGTLRKNLDPFNNYNDDSLWKVLEEVQLKTVVVNSKDELDMLIIEGGKNFSLGQRQLVCLARAIIQNNKILVMDEATANVDLQTDALIQDTIRKKFADCTVLTIAHRLNTVIDSDKILVMNAGEMVEFDHPYNLLRNKNSCFYKMVSEMGKTMTNVLIEMAATSYKAQKLK